MRTPDGDWLDETLVTLGRNQDAPRWLSTGELRERARQRRLRHRTTFTAVSVVVVALAVLVPLVLNGSPAPNAHLRAVDRIGSAVELAAVAKQANGPIGSDGEDQLAGAEQQTSLSLLRHLDEQASPGANVVVAPSSLSVALSMLELGAKGGTANQIATGLGTPSMTALDQAAAWDALNADETAAASRAGIDLESANALWTQDGLAMVPAFMTALAQYFDSGVWQVDFAHNLQAAEDAINAWTSAKTHGRITQLFEPGDLDPQTVVALANASYFKADWAQPFDTSLTTDSPFHLAGGGSESIPMMQAPDLSVPVSETGDAEAVQLPYQGGRFAALVVMPTTTSLSSYVDNLSGAALDQLVAGLHTTSASVSIPRFAISGDENLIGTLQSMGIRDVFEPGEADLTGISPQADYVETVRQRAVLSVTEQGTEAAAATGIGIEGLSQAATSVDFDQPFLFLVRDTKTGAILFSAEVQNPAAR